MDASAFLSISVINATDNNTGNKIVKTSINPIIISERLIIKLVFVIILFTFFLLFCSAGAPSSGLRRKTSLINSREGGCRRQSFF
jgi:hypothetical protein